MAEQSEKTLGAAADAGALVTGVEPDESRTFGKLAAALAKAQGAIHNAAKDAKNPHIGKKYADLGSVWDACRGPLSENELAVVQRVTSGRGCVIITTMLMHASGEYLRDRLELPVSVQTTREGKEAQSYVQALGSAITYGRRYALAAMVGVAPAGDDDDGNAAGGAPERRAPQKSQEAKAPPAWKAPWAEIQAVWAATGRPPAELKDFLKKVLQKGAASELVPTDVERVKRAISDVQAVVGSPKPSQQVVEGTKLEAPAPAPRQAVEVPF